MRFTWDVAKAEANLAKHGVAFDDATLVWQDGAALVSSLAYAAEARSMILGTVDGVVLSVIFTERDGETRVISARMASRQERRRYANQ